VELHLAVELLRLAIADSIPASRIASTTFGQITSAGSSPADSARKSPGA